jgi:hypothetical protein
MAVSMTYQTLARLSGFGNGCKDLARSRREQTRTLLPNCYHFIALIAAAALRSSRWNLCA